MKSLEQLQSEYRTLYQQYQYLAMQKQQLEMQTKELEDAKKDLKTAKGAVFKASGTLLIEVSKTDAEKDLTEKLELITVRLTGMIKQEAETKDRIDTVLKSLQEMDKGLGETK